MEAGRMDEKGLCSEVVGTKYDTLLECFDPSYEERSRWGIYTGYWASGMDVFDFRKHYTYTPLRQTIVLLICAMEGEI